MRSIDVLGREHRLLESMVTVLDAAAARVAAGGEIAPALIAELVAAFAYHVDENHVIKEEQVLFPALEAHGVERNIPVITALTAQHEAGRVYRRELATLCARMAQGDVAARAAFPTLAREYIALLREHMRIEDEYFYSLADTAITPEADDELFSLFRKVDVVSRASERALQTRRVMLRCEAELGLIAEVPAEMQ
jgi:hemerythrin-like domain-containing protein